ncbi:MAG TPA: hypothetical protein VM818_04145 [Vicinamibacterales bacterium]|nr:hypothetical protein [Vicinamibacterales bacterium]
MRRFRRLVLVAVSVFVGALALAQHPVSAQGKASATGLSPVGSILELMLQIVDPIGDAIFESVSVVVTAEGEKETRPTTDAEWLAVRNNAMILAEAGNLLKIPRPVSPTKAAPGIAFEPPGPDDLSPAQVEILLKRDRRAFDAFAQALTDAALVALKAVDERNVEGLYEAGDRIDQACENCHLNYWYPGPDSPVRKNLK